MHFPVITGVRVEGYEMYPGTDGDFILDQPMDAPLTIIMGANGLGKSTLLTLAFRLLTGPNDIPGARERKELGSAKLTVAEIPDRRTFANRVSDRAENATATVRLRVGPSEYEISRSLKNLRLTRVRKDSADQLLDEARLQQSLATAAQLSSFADWILMLRFVTFYLDDRQILFWDPAAQTTLLRSLFLSPGQAAEWLRLERAALTADSEHRNLRNVVNRQRKLAASKVSSSGSGVEKLRTEYARLAQEEAASDEELDAVIEMRRTAESDRAKTNVARLHAQRSREAKATAYERLKLIDLAARFPSANESALLIWSELLAERHCLVCDSDVPELAEEISRRVDRRLCAVCASDLPTGQPATTTSITDAQVRAAWDELVEVGRQLDQLDHNYVSALAVVAKYDEAVQEVEMARADRQARISVIRGMLPTDDDEFAELQSDLARFEARLGLLHAELDEKARDFDQYVQGTIARIVEHADAVKSAFERYSTRFLLGRGELTWQPRSQQLGQSSHSVLVPSFEIRLGGSVDGGKTVRSNAADVSESQKEFIDLAFRMALIETAGESGGSILIDTPESSLDSVFSQRAAEVLAEFCSRGEDHNLIVASNLTDGRLIPAMAKEVSQLGAPPVILNLLEVGRPTVALVELRDEYDRAYSRFLNELKADNAKQ